MISSQICYKMRSYFCLRRELVVFSQINAKVPHRFISKLHTTVKLCIPPFNFLNNHKDQSKKGIHQNFQFTSESRITQGLQHTMLHEVPQNVDTTAMCVVILHDRDSFKMIELSFRRGIDTEHPFPLQLPLNVTSVL